MGAPVRLIAGRQVAGWRARSAKPGGWAGGGWRRNAAKSLRAVAGAEARTICAYSRGFQISA